jgi:hypothetical protein
MVWTIVATDFDRDTAITADRVAFFAERELVDSWRGWKPYEEDGAFGGRGTESVDKQGQW